MRAQYIAAAVAVGVALATAVSAQLAAPSGTSVPPDAVAYHGAMQFYGKIAVWAGQRALAAEKSYYKAVA